MSQYKLIESGRFKKDLKKYSHHPKKLKLIFDCLNILMDEGYLGIPPLIWFQIDEPAKEIRLLRQPFRTFQLES